MPKSMTVGYRLEKTKVQISAMYDCQDCRLTSLSKDSWTDHLVEKNWSDQKRLVHFFKHLLRAKCVYIVKVYSLEFSEALIADG